MRNNSGKHLLILFFVSLVMLIINLGILPVNIMEARNFITAREMVQDNHWILTTMNGEPRYEKPPLPTWITAVIGFVFGFNSVFVLRLAVVFVTLLLVFYIYKFSIKLGLSERNSFHNGLILITSFYIYFAGRDNQWDMYCHSFMIISIYYLWNILRLKTYPFKNAIIGGLFLAFSILSKGPVSLYALFLPFLIAYGWIYKFKFRNQKKHLLSILIYVSIGTIIGGAWSVYVNWVDPEPLAKMAKIETSRWVNDYNSKSFFYYWSFFTQSGIWTISALLSLIYPYMKSRVSNLKVYKFTLIWTLASLLLLSVIPEKKVRYLLPTLIPLALNTGFYIEYIISELKTKTDKIFASINFGIIGWIGVIYPFILFTLFRDTISAQWKWAVASSLGLLTIGILILGYLKNNKIQKAFYSSIFLQCLVIILAFPLAKSFLHNPNYKSARELHRFTYNKMKLYDYRYMTPEIVWDYGEKIPPINKNGIKEKLENSKDNYLGLLCHQKETEIVIKELESDYNVRKISHIDLNIVPPDNEEYKERLVRNFLILIKKN